jgi:hypothetical protein
VSNVVVATQGVSENTAPCVAGAVSLGGGVGLDWELAQHTTSCMLFVAVSEHWGLVSLPSPSATQTAGAAGFLLFTHESLVQARTPATHAAWVRDPISSCRVHRRLPDCAQVAAAGGSVTWPRHGDENTTAADWCANRSRTRVKATGAARCCVMSECGNGLCVEGMSAED